MSTPRSRPPFGALLHGSDAPTEAFGQTGEPSDGGTGPFGGAGASGSGPFGATGATGATGRLDAGARGAALAQQAEPELVVARFRSHGRRLFVPSLFLLAVSGATGYFSGWFPEPWQNYAVLGAGGLLAVLFFLVPFVKWLSHRYVITTRRIVLRNGLLVNTRSELLLSRVHDVTVRKTGLQALFRSGTVRIGTGSGEYSVLRDVPRADLVLSVLGDLMEAQQQSTAAVRFRRPERETSWWDEPRGSS